MSDKDELLSGHEKYQKQPLNISLKSLLGAYLLLFFVLGLGLPKIYIANEIYYTSRDIHELRTKLNVLSEENKELNSKLEKIRYKNQIIDNMNY